MRWACVTSNDGVANQLLDHFLELRMRQTRLHSRFTSREKTSEVTILAHSDTRFCICPRSAHHASDGVALSTVGTGNDTSRCRIHVAEMALPCVAVRSGAHHNRHCIDAEHLILRNVFLEAPVHAHLGCDRRTITQQDTFHSSLLPLHDPGKGNAVGTVLAATNWTCAARAIWTLVEVERLLLAAPAVQLRTARTGRSLVGLDGSETADALLRLLAAGHHGTDGKPTAAGTTASFDPRSAISGADLRLGPGGLGRLAQGPMVGLLLVVSTERNERNTICLFIGGS